MENKYTNSEYISETEIYKNYIANRIKCSPAKGKVPTYSSFLTH